MPPEHVDGVHADASKELGNADAPVTVMMMVLRMCHVVRLCALMFRSELARTIRYEFAADGGVDAHNGDGVDTDQDATDSDGEARDTDVTELAEDLRELGIV